MNDKYIVQVKSYENDEVVKEIPVTGHGKATIVELGILRNINRVKYYTSIDHKG